MINKDIIVSLTSWPARIDNIPAVLDTIFAQSMPPAKVVLNLAACEFPNKELPIVVAEYIRANKVEIIWHDKNKKVFKKLIPTLNKYPDVWVVSIDDDWLYPPTMIEDFWKTHLANPDQPISGNDCVLRGIKYHCGCASMTTKKFFGSYIEDIDEDLYANCDSDDVFYTFVCERNGYHYVQSKERYDQSGAYNSTNPYSFRPIVKNSRKYLESRYHWATVDRMNTGKGLPLCVFGLPNNAKGMEIYHEFEPFLRSNYETHIVLHDGALFEQPALQYMQDLCKQTNRPCLYLHAKGAYNQNKWQSLIRTLWREEFGAKKNLYFDAVNNDKPCVASPFASPDGVTWYNGFVANAEAMRTIPPIRPCSDRYVYECIFRHTNVQVKGLLRGDIENMPYKNNTRDMNQYLLEHYAS